jgi:hypothetical protein
MRGASCVWMARVTSPSQLVNVTVDTVRPVVWLPSSPSRYSVNATAVTVCRSDASPGTIVASLNVDVVSVTAVGGGDVCANVSVAADGSYLLTVGSSDAAGNCCQRHCRVRVGSHTAAVLVPDATATVRVQRQRVAAAVIQRCVVAGVAERACRRRRVIRGTIESTVRGLE